MICGALDLSSLDCQGSGGLPIAAVNIRAGSRASARSVLKLIAIYHLVGLAELFGQRQTQIRVGCEQVQYDRA